MSASARQRKHEEESGRDLRLALLYKTVTGHVAINPDQIGLVAADNRTRANHRSIIIGPDRGDLTLSIITLLTVRSSI